jgi:hypothetical protein
MFDFGFETAEWNRHQYQCEVFREILAYHPEGKARVLMSQLSQRLLFINVAPAINIIPVDQQMQFANTTEPSFLHQSGGDDMN